MHAARLHLHLLGPFRLLQGGQPVAGFDQARLQHLLAYLVLQRDALISRQQLAFTFWPDTTDRQAFKNLRTLLARLRQALPEADRFIAVTAQTLRWRPDAPLTLDLAAFEAAVTQAAAARARGDHAGAAAASIAAAAAYTGDLLPDCYDDWILPLRERTRRAYGEALEQVVLALEERRDYGDAIPYAQRLLHHDPLSEAAYRHLMRLHLAQGSWTDALRVYQACEEALQREFGTTPARVTRDLHRRLLQMKEGPLLALAGHAGRRAEAPPLHLPLVGRQAEWARLVAAWRAAAAGRPQMILLSGEAGIGKTRLAEELVAWAGRQGATTATARGYPEGGALAYAPVVEWLSDAALRPRLAALDDVWLVEVGRLLPALLAERPRLAPPGLLTEAWQRTRLYEALARAVLGSGDPLALLLDDLQWSDRATLDWIAYLLHRSADAPLLIVGTLRGYEMDKDHPWVAARLALAQAGLLTEISLLPLDAAETAALAASVTGRAVGAEEATQIFHETEGNPLFIVEMARARMGDGKTGGRENGEAGGARGEGLSPGASSPALPPKVAAVLQWRLAALSPAAHALAQTAAVIGRKFTYPVLAHASGQDEAAVMQGLDELWQRQVVRVQDDGAYDFSHDGIRAVAYESISPILRGGMHLRVAQALEACCPAAPDAFSIQLAGQIAAHYERAGRAQPAIAFYRRAAAAAQRVYANAEALRLYAHLLEGGLRTSLAPHETCEIMLAAAEVWRITGRWARARIVNQEALALAERLGDVRLQAQAQRALAAVLHLLGYYDAALEWLNQAEHGFEATGEWRGVVSTLWTMGQIFWFRGAYPQALTVLERQLRIATDIGDERGVCEALETLGMVYWSQGDWEQAADCCLSATRIAGPLEYKLILSRAAITLGNVRSSERWFGEAVYWYLRAGVLAGEIDDRQAISWATSNIALVLAKRGDYPRAGAGYERSLRNAWEIGDRWTACLNIAGLAAINERRGQTDLAESLYRKAIGFGRWLGIPGYLAGMLVSLARLLLARGRAAEAAGFYAEAWPMISGAAGERLAGADTRFDAQVLGLRLRQALGECSAAEAAAELCGLLACATAPHRQAALHYELWRLTATAAAPDVAAQGIAAGLAAGVAAAAFYRAEYAETGADECRSRYRELTGEELPDPPPLPDVSELIPDEPAGLDLAHVLAELETSFDQAP